MSIIHIAFYPSDWLAGTRGMTAEETGVYITLVARMYEMAGPIERDDQRLARLCGCKTKSAFAKVLDYLISEGKIIDTKDGLFQERVQKEIKNTTEKSEKAKAAAQSRWDRKPNKNNGDDNANASAKHMPQGCQSEPESYIREEPKGSLSSDADIQAAFDAYNNSASQVGWPKAQVLNKSRKAGIKARLADAGGINGWEAALAKARASPLCTGQSNRDWCADLDFLLQPKSFTRLMEGSYDERSNKPTASRTSGKRADPAIDNALRLAGIGAAPGNSGH